MVAQASRARLGRRFPFLRHGYYGLAALLRPGVTRVGTWTVYFHRGDIAISHALRAESTYEPFELELIARLLRSGDCAVDVGANIGLHTLAMSAACGPTGRVLAFEPDPGNLRLCRRNLEVNECKNVELLPVAVSDQPGTLRLFLNSDNRGDHRVYDPGDGRGSLDVAAVPLAEVLADRQLTPRLLKIDVQGWEPKVLRGALPGLRGPQPLVLMTEFWTAGLVAAGSSAREYLELIDELQLDLYEIDAWRGWVAPITPDRSTLLKAERNTNLLGLRGVSLGSFTDELLLAD
jgi:FkbM family methyltransferase